MGNNAASPYYGRMYVSWNDFGAGQGIYCVYSDNGTTWTKTTVVGSFIRNTQLTGSKGSDGTVVVMGMNEGGGGGANRTNICYRSTNGGVTWTQIVMGSAFGAPGQTCPGGGYFYMIPPIWRHMGWGQPGVGPSSVVHYDYCGRGVNGGDTADVYYTRPTDNGTTWSTPIVLNSDQASGGTQAQWMPSLTVTPGGTVLATWYDRRNTTNGTNHEYWGRISTDNGQSWQADQPISDVVITQPAQPDSSVQSCYAGDYNFITTQGQEAYVVWTDGRNQVSGVNQQDVYFDKVAFCPTITLSPTTLPNGTVGSAYSQTITATGGTPSYSFAVTAGALPAGLSLSFGGLLSGTPTATGTASFTITATDSAGCSGSQPYTLTIDCATITISPATLPDAILGSAYGQSLSASGGTAPYTFSLSGGALPPGLILTSWGVIQGTPTSIGSFGFTVAVSDAASCTASRTYTLRVVQKIDFVVGAGLGQPNANQVRAYDGTGSATAVNFFAYGAGKWGVNVAGGDIDGDLFGEIVTGPGPGDVFGPQMRGFDRTGMDIVAVNIYAYGTLRFGVNVATSDLDSDAISEILTGAGPGDVFGPHVRGWNYDGTKLTPIRAISFFAYKTLKYGVNVSGGDVDADSFFEILTGPGPSPVFAPTVRGFNYDGSKVTTIAGMTFNAFPVSGYGANVAGGDVDADGYAEVEATLGPSPAYGSRFRGFNYDAVAVAALPGFDKTPFSTKYGGRVGTGNVDGMSGDDLLAGAGRDPAAVSTVKAFQYGGSSLTLLPGQFTPFGNARYGVNVSAGPLGY